MIIIIIFIIIITIITYIFNFYLIYKAKKGFNKCCCYYMASGCFTFAALFKLIFKIKANIMHITIIKSFQFSFYSFL